MDGTKSSRDAKDDEIEEQLRRMEEESSVEDNQIKKELKEEVEEEQEASTKIDTAEENEITPGGASKQENVGGAESVEAKTEAGDIKLKREEQQVRHPNDLPPPSSNANAPQYAETIRVPSEDGTTFVHYAIDPKANPIQVSSLRSVAQGEAKRVPAEIVLGAAEPVIVADPNFGPR